MQPEQSVRLEHLLGSMSVGVAILDCSDMRVRYVNPYLLSLLEEPWRSQGGINQLLNEVLPDEVRKIALPLLEHVCLTGQRMSWSALPFDGFLRARGRTYWRVSIERSPSSVASHENAEAQQTQGTLLITIEDVTELARSSLYLNAIHYISAAIAGPFALPQVLDRILESVQDLVGSTRCAILLIDASAETFPTTALTPKVTVAAQQGVHLRSQDWHPQLSEQLLLGHVVRTRRTFVISDTSTVPEMKFPLLDDNGIPCRPGSALGVPIFEPTSDPRPRESTPFHERKGADIQTGKVIGTIEVYHRGVRGFPAEEVELLEQFARQAGLAIQNARLFRRINRLARDASRTARQQKNVMQAIPDGVIIYDSRWRVADANPAVRHLLGWSDDVIGLPIAEALARSTAILDTDFHAVPDLMTELDRRALARQVDELKLIGADGKHYTIRRSYAPIHDEVGDLFAFVVVYHDVTEQALARERIEAEVIARTAELAQRNRALQIAKAAQELESARMELLLERLPSGVMLISAEDKRITIMNRQATQLLQRTGLALGPLDEPDRAAKNAIGKDVEDLFRNLTLYGPSGSIVPYEQQPLSLTLCKGEANEAELHALQPDGQPLFVLVSSAPLRASDGTITNVVLVLHETTRLKALERVREDFFTTLAHELKTPLANIRAHVSALQAKDLRWSADKQLDFLQTADEQVERLVRMINHFLDASRVEAGALRLELEPILLPEMLEDLQERLEALITTSGRHLTISISPHVPAVIADYELIISVLTNLLSNAFRYAPEDDTVLLEVQPMYDGHAQQPTHVELRVSDQGPGLSLEQQAELFTRFSTFAAARRPAVDRPGQPVERRRGDARWSPASGLGLYISRGIIEAHGSILTVKSSPGQGATFGFLLTVAHSPEKEVR